MISFWLRLKSSNENPLLSEMYNYLLFNNGDVVRSVRSRKFLRNQENLIFLMR